MASVLEQVMYRYLIQKVCLLYMDVFFMSIFS